MRRQPVAWAAFVGVLLTLPPWHARAQDAQAPAAAAIADPAGAKVWLGHYAEYEDYLKTAAIQKVGDIPVGVTKPKRAFFEPGGLAGSAALKYLPSGMPVADIPSLIKTTPAAPFACRSSFIAASST